MIQRTAPCSAVRRRAAPCGADGAQTGAALLRRTARRRLAVWMQWPFDQWDQEMRWFQIQIPRLRPTLLVYSHTNSVHWLLMLPADHTRSASRHQLVVPHHLCTTFGLLSCWPYGLEWAAWRRPRSGAGIQHISTHPQDISGVLRARYRCFTTICAIQIYYWHWPPNTATEHYNLCSASSHNRLLPAHTGHLTDANFITRWLYKNCY